VGEKVDAVAVGELKHPRLDRGTRAKERRVTLAAPLAHWAGAYRLNGSNDGRVVAVHVDCDETAARGTERNANANAGSVAPNVGLKLGRKPVAEALPFSDPPVGESGALRPGHNWNRAVAVGEQGRGGERIRARRSAFGEFAVELNCRIHSCICLSKCAFERQPRQAGKARLLFRELP
jgi:hypothetical protein